MIRDKDATMLGDLRQSLLRGYGRLRQALAQGRQLSEAERVLELLGDPQVLVLRNPQDKCVLRIPLVYVASWNLERNKRIREELYKFSPDSELTLYRRRQDENSHGEIGITKIHTSLVRIINSYVRNGNSKALLLDLVWLPHENEQYHDEITSESWAGIHHEKNGSHWLFGDMESQMPDQIRDVNSLVRLTFPLYPKATDSCTMITLVLGLTIESTDEDFEVGTKRKWVKWIRRLAEEIMTEVPHLHEVLQSRKSVGGRPFNPPDWLEVTERSALHSAVDDLHRRIADFAERAGAEGWHLPENGFNFLIAFKEYDSNYKACLRYRLSLLNLHALGSGSQRLEDWQGYFESSLSKAEADLRNLFDREYGNVQQGGQGCRDYIARCSSAIKEIFERPRNLEEAKRTIKEMIETSPYRMRLTPGYYVMNLNHPEIIKAWLRDPRAAGFADYPGKLFVWEATALPTRIYYSQVADGSLPIGVCGVNADILRAVQDYYELQEIIDESGPRLRYILREEELGHLKLEFRDALEKTKDSRVWVPLLDRFRRLAYYYLANPYDYYTKLVSDDDVDAMKWSSHPGHQFTELRGLSEADIAILAKENHIPSRERWQDELTKSRSAEKDFIKGHIDEIENRGDSGERRRLRESSLYRVKIGAAERVSLLLLVPDARNGDLVRRLIDRFCTLCRGVYEDYERWVKTYGRSPSETNSGKYDVFLSYNRADKTEADEIVRVLRLAGFIPWTDQEIIPGEKWMRVIEQNADQINVAIIVVGSHGLGPYQDDEIQLFYQKNQQRYLIPVRLQGAPELEGFLKTLQVVDYNNDPNPNEQLIKAVKASLKRVLVGPANSGLKGTSFIPRRGRGRPSRSKKPVA